MALFNLNNHNLHYASTTLPFNNNETTTHGSNSKHGNTINADQIDVHLQYSNQQVITPKVHEQYVNQRVAPKLPPRANPTSNSTTTTSQYTNQPIFTKEGYRVVEEPIGNSLLRTSPHLLRRYNETQLNELKRQNNGCFPFVASGSDQVNDAYVVNQYRREELEKKVVKKQKRRKIQSVFYDV